MARKNKKICFEKIEVIDAGAKGKSIAKAPDGKIIFLSNAIPGDVVDIQTFKKRKAYYQGKAIKFHKLSEKEQRLNVNTLELVVVVNGNTWITNTNCFTRK